MYDIPKLEYSYDALLPYLDAETIRIHYELHHRGYLNNLNDILNSLNYNYRFTIEELVQNIDEFPIDLRGNILFYAGGVLNHNLYWHSMSPNKNIFPVGKLQEAIINQYGSFENFKEQFIIKANNLLGSGYTFLVINNEGNLDIINLSNQETPYSYNLIPILALDLWEHAYYLKYHNRRSEYINNFFNIVDFVKVNELYEKNT